MTDFEFKPGRQLDTLVAEKVMGLETYKDVVPFCPQCGFKFYPKGPGRMWCHQCSEWIYSSTKDYSTSIEAAWEVVEKLRKEQMCFTLTDIGYAGSILCCVGNGEAIAETAPHAICLAALKAIGYSPNPK